MTTRLMPGAEPFSHQGGPNGVLVCHGFTGNPGSMRSLAQAFAAADYTVELPLWPGHGTSVEDMIPTRWDDWAGAAEAAYNELAARVERVVVVGLSMGGTLTCRLAVDHPDIAGIVCINPAVEPPAESFIDVVKGMAETGADRFQGIGSDIAMPGVSEGAYPETPIPPLLSMFEAQAELAPRLGEIRCPLLLLNSPQDHVVPPSNAEFLASRVAGPVERVLLERSFHVATMDYDREEIEHRAVEFANKVTAA